MRSMIGLRARKIMTVNRENCTKHMSSRPSRAGKMLLSLHYVSTSSSRVQELEPFQLVEENRDDSLGSLRLTRIEWAFGLKYRGFSMESEYNITTVPGDLKQLLQKRYLIFAPTTAVIQLAYDIIKHNRSARAEDRRGLQEFGEGPWEYTLFPGRYHKETLEPDFLPPLYHHSPDGSVSPVKFDTTEVTKLPRLSLDIHPAISIMFLKERSLDGFHVPRSLKDNTVIPLLRVFGIWPLWRHNRFIDTRTSSKRKRSESAASRISCICSECAQDAVSSTPSLSTPNESAGSEDEAVLHNIAEERPVGLGIAAWAGKVVLPPVRCGYDDFDDVGDDELLRNYAQESALAPARVKKALKEENMKRGALAQPTLEQLRYSLKKRSRRN